MSVGVWRHSKLERAATGSRVHASALMPHVPARAQQARDAGRRLSRWRVAGTDRDQLGCTVRADAVNSHTNIDDGMAECDHPTDSETTAKTGTHQLQVIEATADRRERALVGGDVRGFLQRLVRIDRDEHCCGSAATGERHRFTTVSELIELVGEVGAGTLGRVSSVRSGEVRTVEV